MFPCLCPPIPPEQKLASTNQPAIRRSLVSSTGAKENEHQVRGLGGLSQSPRIAVNLERVLAERWALRATPALQELNDRRRGKGSPPGGAGGRRALGRARGPLRCPRGHFIQTGFLQPARAPHAPAVSARPPPRRGWSPRGREVPLASGVATPGRESRGAQPQPAGRRRGRTHRAWPPCRPRRAGSPRGRAPPAGRCTPPRRPAARAAAALCSAPWAPGRVRPEGAQPVPAPRAPASARSFTLGRECRPRASSSPASSPAFPAPPGAGEGAPPPAPASGCGRRRAPPSGQAAAAGGRAGPGLGSGADRGPRAGGEALPAAGGSRGGRFHTFLDAQEAAGAGCPMEPGNAAGRRGLIWAAWAWPAGPRGGSPPPASPQSPPGRCTTLGWSLQRSVPQLPCGCSGFKEALSIELTPQRGSAFY